MKLKSLLIGIGAVLLVGVGAAWSIGTQSENWVWELAPKQPGYVPDPADINFYYPLPQVVEFTSPFGYRTHPIYGDRRLHAGVDLGAPEGMPVLSAHAGYVKYAQWESGYGNLIIVEYADGQYQTWYAHLSEILVQEGDPVRPRQVIGKVGSTGGVTGPHLHFELRQKQDGDFVAIDPTTQVRSVEAFVAVRPPGPQQSAKNPAIATNPPTQPPTQSSTNAPWQAPALDAPPTAEKVATAPPIAPSQAEATAEAKTPSPTAADNITLTFDPQHFSN